MKIKIILSAIYILFWYIIAFFENIKYRSKDDFLFISKTQWIAMFVLCVPILLIFIK